MAKLADANNKKEAKLADAKKKKEAELADAKKKKKEAKLAIMKKTKEEMMPDDGNQDLLEPNLTWEQKVVNILQMVRCRELIEYNHKLGFSAPTCFWAFNIAFFGQRV